MDTKKALVLVFISKEGRLQNSNDTWMLGTVRRLLWARTSDEDGVMDGDLQVESPVAISGNEDFLLRKMT